MYFFYKNTFISVRVSYEWRLIFSRLLVFDLITLFSGKIFDDLKPGYIEFGVVRIDSAIVVCILSAIIQLLLTWRVSYCHSAG